MKINLKKIAFVGAFVGITLQVPVSAQILVPLDPTTPIIENTIPNTTLGPSNTGTTATDGYEIFQALGGSSINVVENLPSYLNAIAITAPNVYATASTNLTVGSTDYSTGSAYGNASAGTPLSLMSITFSASNPIPAFNLGVLYQYNDPVGSVFTATLYDGDPSLGGTSILSSAVLNPNQSKNAPTTNQFYFASVTGAAPGDYLVVSALQQDGLDGQVSTGGVTFDTIMSVPEPSDSVLILMGMIVIVIIGRLRTVDVKLPKLGNISPLRVASKSQMP